ncbi:MAG: hypothetical protein ABDH28_02710 [Brevinematia bacterium]
MFQLKLILLINSTHSVAYIELLAEDIHSVPIGIAREITVDLGPYASCIMPTISFAR